MYLGLDLGTSNSVIAGASEGAAQIFRPADGGDALPSVIYIDKRGHRLYGRRAYDQAMLAPENVAAGYKRLMGTATPITVAGQTLTPEECTAEIIRQLIGQASTDLGEDTFDGVVIAVPASFNQMQSEATLRAAKMAGLEQVDLIQEPVAAAMASMVEAKRSGKFLVYDLGGGTFDVALVEATQGQVKILAQQGVNMLGGRDFDRMIVHEIVRPWLLANFDLPDNFLRDPAYRRLAQIAQLAAERAKIDLSLLEEASIFASDDEVRLLDQSECEIFLDAPITRAQFEEILHKPVQHTLDLIVTLLAENEVEANQIDRIVFVGGPSRIPYIRRQVTETLGIVADLKTDPMTAVAEGAAYYCESRSFPAAQDALSWENSTPKETEAHAVMEEAPDLSFDYEARTPDDKAAITVHSAQDKGARRIRLMTEGWDSGMIPLSAGLTIEAPLQKVGENVFDVHVMDESGAQFEDHAERLKITRLVASPAAVPAAHSIAVKVRQSAEAEENNFLMLVNKGDPLPASGQLSLKSGAMLRARGAGVLGFEVFQVEYPERVELNLCVGALRIEGADLPSGTVIRLGDPILFDWQMNSGGVLRASVSLPASELVLPAKQFYAPQAAEISYDSEEGYAFTKALLTRALEDWGDLAAAVGPVTGPELALLKTRLDEQAEILEESKEDGETVRRISEEARFIRQESARLEIKYQGPVFQRRLGKLVAAYNRISRARAQEAENKAFDALAQRAQQELDERQEGPYGATQTALSQMKRLFFAIAWRNPAYVKAWFNRLKGEAWLYADKEAFAGMVKEGLSLIEKGEDEALRAVVEKMLEERLSLGTGDMAGDLATIMQG
ncbi:MAG: Hsp70 family protein [Bdellovibrionales bacterium]|jgi:molecular chaperone DnaK